MSGPPETDFPAKIPRSASEFEQARAAVAWALSRPLGAALTHRCARDTHLAPHPGPQVHKLPPASEYERANRPYAPLSASEKLPTMAENWTCAARACWRCLLLRCAHAAVALRCAALTRRCD
jgi:hypothetical protein